MNWIYAIPEWVVLFVAAWFSALALWVLWLYLRGMHRDIFEDDDAFAEPSLHEQMRAREIWQDERAGRVHSFTQPAAKGAEAFKPPAHRWTNKDGDAA